MLIIGSTNAAIGVPAGREALAAGADVIDVVCAVTRAVEDDTTDHTVGYSGFPNLLGEVELDASIMEGATRRAGTVGGLRGYRAAITVARAVMERLPHVTVVGEGAARLAAEIGLEPEDLLTTEAAEVWRRGIANELPEGSIGARMLGLVRDLTQDPERVAEIAEALRDRDGTDSEFGTVNVLGRDDGGRLVSAVSTSGWAFKYPGRLGDSPIIGAGNYCDDRYGAAACTGFGELAIRASTARMVVAHLAQGLPVADACAAALSDLHDLPDASLDIGGVNVVAIDAAGNHAGASTRADQKYLVWDGGVPEILPRHHVT